MKNELRNNLILALIIIVMIGVYALSIGESKESTAPHANNGILNLENWNWSESKIIQLNGEWNYYPSLLREDLNADTISSVKRVPHFWETDSDLNYSPYGYATYRLQITGLEPLSIYGLEILDEVTAYRLFANDVLAASNGIVSKESSTYLPYWHPEQSVFQADENGKVELTMEIANFAYYRGGFWNSIKMGNINDIFAEVNRGKMLDLFLFTSIFIVGLLNFFLFLIYQRDKTILYFALFCFCMSIRILLIGQRLISDIIPISNWNMLVRLEYLLGYLLLPLFGLFVNNLFEKYFHPIHKYVFKIFIICCFIVVLILPNSVYTAFLVPYKWLSVVFVLYITYLFTKAIIERQSAGKLMIFVALGMIISIFKEVFLGGTMSWMPFGTLIFIICFSLITFHRFLSVLRENDILETKVVLDPLTGLYNRNYLMEFEQNSSSIQKSQKKYIMFLDLDRFKEINDTYGHKTGDYILQEIGQRLRNYLRNTDIICRYGGDEFIIIFDSRLEDIKTIADRIIQIIQEPFEVNENSYSVSVSIGISEINDKTQNIETLIKNSDKAMYEAKRNGGSQYFFWDN